MTPYTYELGHMAGWSLHTPTRKLLFGVGIVLYGVVQWRLGTTGASGPAAGAFPWAATVSTFFLPLLAVGLLIFDHLQGGRYYVTISAEEIAWRIGTYGLRHRISMLKVRAIEVRLLEAHITTVAGARYTLPLGELPYAVVGQMKARLESLAERRPLARSAVS